MEEGGRASVRQQFQIERERRRVGGRLPVCHGSRRGAPSLHICSEILPLLVVVSLICGTGPHVNETWCVISRAKCDLAALARGAALVIGLYFFNGALFSFEARLTGTVRRENINYSTTTPPPVLVV